MSIDETELESMRIALEQARGVIQKQDRMLKRLTASPVGHAIVLSIPTVEVSPEILAKKGTVVRIRRDSKFADQSKKEGIVLGRAKTRGWVTVKFPEKTNDYRTGEGGLPFDLEMVGGPVIMNGGRIYRVEMPDFPVVPGDTVELSVESGQIIGKSEITKIGQIATVQKSLPSGLSEVDLAGQNKIVFNGRSEKTERGERVVLDDLGMVILENLGKSEDRFKLRVEAKVSWSDIGGLVQAKKEMVEAVELPYTNPQIFEYYGQKPPKGILLYGPPGTGKTMLGKAVATSMAQIHGQSQNGGFMYVKGPEILDKYVGVSEATIRRIFETARKHKQDHGFPAVVFIDEADAILGRRGSGISSDIERTIVPMFLAEMDGLDDAAALVILATNRQDILDPAIVRDGRVDRKIRVERPGIEAVRDISLINLKNIPIAEGGHESLADLVSTELFDQKKTVCVVKTRKLGEIPIRLSDVCNGAMVVSVVNQARSSAMNRDIQNKKKTGLIPDDIVRAVNDVWKQNLDIDHSWDVHDFAQSLNDEALSVRRATV